MSRVSRSAQLDNPDKVRAFTDLSAKLLESRSAAMHKEGNYFGTPNLELEDTDLVHSESAKVPDVTFQRVATKDQLKHTTVAAQELEMFTDGLVKPAVGGGNVKQKAVWGLKMEFARVRKEYMDWLESFTADLLCEVTGRSAEFEDASSSMELGKEECIAEFATQKLDAMAKINVVEDMAAVLRDAATAAKVDDATVADEILKKITSLKKQSSPDLLEKQKAARQAVSGLKTFVAQVEKQVAKMDRPMRGRKPPAAQVMAPLLVSAADCDTAVVEAGLKTEFVCFLATQSSESQPVILRNQKINDMVVGISEHKYFMTQVAHCHKVIKKRQGLCGSRVAAVESESGLQTLRPRRHAGWRHTPQHNPGRRYCV